MNAPSRDDAAAGGGDLWPVVTYAMLSASLLGLCAVVSVQNVPTDPSNRDIWQHVAALRALMADPFDPVNPFVATDQTSRHFQPIWVLLAGAANLAGWSVWQALSLASGLFMGVLALGLYVFAKTYFRTPWAPVVLLVVVLLGWAVQLQHTGALSLGTLLYAATYPATLLIGLSMLLWALVLRALTMPIWAILIVPLVTLMVTTHQLGAAIGIVGAGAFVLAQPDVRLSARAKVSVAVLAGLGLSMIWPYYNPVTLVFAPGNSQWEGGQDFYSASYLTLPFVPAILGLLGLTGRSARPLVLALVLYTGLFLLGLAGFQIASRMMMPMILILHIGLAGLLLQFGPSMMDRLPGSAKTAGAVGVATVAFLVWDGVRDFDVVRAPQLSSVPVYQAAADLTDTIDDRQEIAAYGLAAWPIVATGQRVVSVPWPEPGIDDLSDRQAKTRALLAPALAPDARRALAGDLGVFVLIVDLRHITTEHADTLRAAGLQTRQIGPLLRIDLS